MPTYTMKNTETDEIIDMFLSLSEREVFLQKNSKWIQQLSIPNIVSDTKGALSRTDDGWKATLKKIKENSGRDNTINL